MNFLPIVNHSLKYNPSIDGLRGIAVLLVLLFHIYPNVFSFGFVGVDIFFVLSGYLITQIIYSNLENHQFSIIKFYRNRIRRIFPALIIVLITSIIIGYIFLYPIELASLGKHIKSSAFFYENFRLSREVGYWDEAAQLKPLLHFWSLAIEEQFYIFWPLVLLFLFRLKLNNIKYFAIVCISLFLFPFIFEVDKFYNIVSRAWELSFGGLAFIVSYKYKNIHTLIEKQKWIFYILFLLAIAFSYKNVSFSTFKTCLVVLSTCLLIISLSKPNDRYEIFSNKFLVFMGLISYPLYLWHYMLISYCHIIGIDVEKNGIYIILISIILSYMVYRFVEIYARAQKSYQFAFSALFLVISIGLLGNYMDKKEGFSDRNHLKKYVQNYEYFETQFKRTSATNENGLNLIPKIIGYHPHNDYIKSSSSDISKKFILIIGDSHAHTSYYGFNQIAQKHGYETILLANSSCPPYINGEMGKNMNELLLCQDKIKAIYELVNSNLNIEKIIFATRFGYMYDMGYGVVDGNNKPWHYHYRQFFENKENYHQKDLFFSVVENTFDFFSAKQNRQFYFLMENPELGFSPKNCLNRVFMKSKHHCTISIEAYQNRAGEYRKWIYDLSHKYPMITILDPKELFCDKQFCHAIKNGKLMYADDNHHSTDGSIEQAEYFEDIIMRPVDNETR